MSSLAVGVAFHKALIKRFKESPHGATIVVANRDEAESFKDKAWNAGRSDLKFKTQETVDWEAKAGERAAAAEKARQQRILDDMHSRELVEEGHALKEIEGTW